MPTLRHVLDMNMHESPVYLCIYGSSRLDQATHTDSGTHHNHDVGIRDELSRSDLVDPHCVSTNVRCGSVPRDPMLCNLTSLLDWAAISPFDAEPTSAYESELPRRIWRVMCICCVPSAAVTRRASKSESLLFRCHLRELTGGIKHIFIYKINDC